MANGKIKLYNKLTNSTLVEVDIVGSFSIEDNLNDMPSNMKLKSITSNTYREEFEVNTIAHHEDTNSWWVIKSDSSTYLQNGEYEHETEFVEYLEWYSYKHLPTCSFAPNTYTLETMLDRLFKIAKLSVSVVYPSFLDKDKIMPFISFDNFTVANAIKNISRSINAIPKMYIDTGFVAKLTFVNRSGLDNEIDEDTLNDKFPVAYEKNINSSDQFLTRSVSNISNAKSSNLVISPKSGGFKNVSPNSPTYIASTAIVPLPSKIDKIDFVRIYPPIVVRFGASVIFNGYYIDKSKIIQAITDSTISGLTTGIKNTMISNLPDVFQFQQVNYNDVIDETYNPATSDNNRANIFFKKMSLLSKFEFDLLDDEDVKERTIHWKPFTNELVMSLSFRNGLGTLSDHNPTYSLYETGGVPTGFIQTLTRSIGFFDNKVPNDEVLIQVGYYPISDIKVSIDNENDSQDEKFFNQTGKVIDSVSVTRLITSHTNDSVEGTKIRNAKYTDFSDLLPLGQIVREGSQLYVVSQRSIDCYIKNNNEYYNVVYTLTRNRIGRSENIVADSAVISYKTPDDNLVFRNQLYKDYIELSLTDGNHDTPYLPLNKIIVFSNSLAGTSFDYTVLAENTYREIGATTNTSVRYVKNPTIYELYKSKLLNVNWQDNNILGFRLDSTGDTYVQTPIAYTNELGFARLFSLFFLDTENLTNAINHFANQYPSAYALDPQLPFSDLTKVNDLFFGNSVGSQGNFSLNISESDYSKDAFEIPVFEYMIQANDDYTNIGNIVVGGDLFSDFAGTLRYHYVINNSTRFTSENADKLYGTAPSSTVRRTIFTRNVGTPHILDLDLFSSTLFSGTRNSSTIKNIGIYATDGTNVKFLFAINDYVESGSNDKSNIRVYINNWKI